MVPIAISATPAPTFSAATSVVPDCDDRRFASHTANVGVVNSARVALHAPVRVTRALEVRAGQGERRAAADGRAGRDVPPDPDIERPTSADPVPVGWTAGTRRRQRARRQRHSRGRGRGEDEEERNEESPAARPLPSLGDQGVEGERPSQDVSSHKAKLASTTRYVKPGDQKPYRSSRQGSASLWYPRRSQKPGWSAETSSRPVSHFALFQK